MAVTIVHNGTNVTGEVSFNNTTLGNGTISLDYPADGSTVWVSSIGGEWMGHPMTADEIIDQGARELARRRPAD